MHVFFSGRAKYVREHTSALHFCIQMITHHFMLSKVSRSIHTIPGINAPYLIPLEVFYQTQIIILSCMYFWLFPWLPMLCRKLPLFPSWCSHLPGSAESRLTELLSETYTGSSQTSLDIIRAASSSLRLSKHSLLRSCKKSDLKMWLGRCIRSLVYSFKMCPMWWFVGTQDIILLLVSSFPTVMYSHLHHWISFCWS